MTTLDVEAINLAFSDTDFRRKLLWDGGAALSDIQFTFLPRTSANDASVPASGIPDYYDETPTSSPSLEYGDTIPIFMLPSSPLLYLGDCVGYTRNGNGQVP